jgi:hypothetical protein
MRRVFHIGGNDARSMILGEGHILGIQNALRSTGTLNEDVEGLGTTKYY